MTTFLLTALLMFMVVGAMAVGVLVGRKPIAGSCGGLSALGMKTSCEVCGGDRQRCTTAIEEAAAAGDRTELGYDAMAESNDSPRRTPPA